ncbi:peptidase S8/S53 domain-containing protein [Cantharellus anzutake]|uniref:peptidase S8/S53 domain-containing protein n=1 Tax=Cantharellus anzutake TaxID=1750568 RepID=UPI001906C064|nr:peptidase S8/S53 domain-containing protein [Cantharellus anzutake]XP_038918148.1 peptidase S8/S53 domain-containing protein [Cantharellus anzutake]KAF8318927.1 peptidase S8/S53 domain-containing protein [Cantharellus anzutake]KAF8334642.1 peptidase S8/S53 domain-containing protein [Cantharellus anzutake]
MFFVSVAFGSIMLSTPNVRRTLSPPPPWMVDSAPPPDYPLTLRFALRQGNFPSLEKKLLDISNPLSPRWRQHLTKQEVENFTRPTNETLRAVDAFLSSHGINLHAAHRSPALDWISVNVTVSKAEAILNATYMLYSSVYSGKMLLRCASYDLPNEVHPHIDTVQPTNYFGPPEGRRSDSFERVGLRHSCARHCGDLLHPGDGGLTMARRSGKPRRLQAPSGFVDPQYLMSVYGFTNYTASSNRSMIAVANFLGDRVNLEDTKLFWEKLAPHALNSTPSIENVNGGSYHQYPGSGTREGSLDFQYASALTYPTRTVIYSTTGLGPGSTNSMSNEPYDILLPYMLAKEDDKLPTTMSISYADDERSIPIDYATRICQMYAELGVRGVSVLHASGDHGVGGTTPYSCQNTRGAFVPSFPASCPYVTAVGSTSSWPEVAAYFSGGGFSNYFIRPSYQNEAVSSYASRMGGQFRGKYNDKGRAYPDIAALGMSYLYILNGTVVETKGTSASTPTVAAIVSHLNDMALMKRGKTLGFLNPLLYQLQGRGMNDIINGSNPGCNTGGFEATDGWDPVTGWGSPDFPSLANIINRMNTTPPTSGTAFSVFPNPTNLAGSASLTVTPPLMGTELVLNGACCILLFLLLFI